MDKKDSVLKLWRECFDDTDQYVDMFFSEVYRDEDALVLEEEGRIVSSMMLQRYTMNFHGVTSSVSYVCGAATAKSLRGHGYMRRLMGHALRESYRRGDILCTLIPAGEWLYHYYGHMGFSPVFYMDKERYTSAHKFRSTGVYSRYYDLSGVEAYGFFNRIMESRPCAVQHTRRQYDEILMDNSADAGAVIALADSHGSPVAMAFAVPDADEVVVKDVLAVDGDSRAAVLAEVLREFAGCPMTVYGYYDAVRDNDNYVVRGMARVVNVEKCLSVIAGRYTGMKLSIRVNDAEIDENNGVYTLADGKCMRNDEYGGELDYDIDVEVFTSIIFGNDVTRRLLDFPAERPFISLMLD